MKSLGKAFLAGAVALTTITMPFNVLAAEVESEDVYTEVTTEFRRGFRINRERFQEWCIEGRDLSEFAGRRRFNSERMQQIFAEMEDFDLESFIANIEFDIERLYELRERLEDFDFARFVAEIDFDVERLMELRARIQDFDLEAFLEEKGFDSERLSELRAKIQDFDLEGFLDGIGLNRERLLALRTRIMDVINLENFRGFNRALDLHAVAQEFDIDSFFTERDIDVDALLSSLDSEELATLIQDFLAGVIEESVHYAID